jgi:ATP:corrinoid adenosyltransferase
MAGLKPQELIELFEDLAFRLARNSDALRSLVNDAEFAQRYVSEHRTRLCEQVQIQRQLVDDDVTLVDKLSLAADSAESTTRSTLGDLQAGHGEVVQTLQLAKGKLDAWQTEEDAARDSLHAAELALARAVDRLQQAESEVEQANAAVQQARNALSACQSQKPQDDKRPNDCSGEQAALQAAEQKIATVQTMLDQAKAEREQAAQAVTMAQNRLDRAVQAVASAGQAVALSSSAEQDASYSVDVASRALELAVTTNRSAGRLRNLCDAQRDLLGQLTALSQQVDLNCEEAADLLRQIVLQNTTIEHLSLGCRNDLALRSDDLRRLESSFTF